MMLKKGHDPVSLLPVEVVFTYLFLPVTDAQFLWEGEREREREIYGGMWGEDGLCMAHVENRKPITPLRSAIRLNVFICFTCKYTVTLYCKHTILDI